MAAVLDTEYLKLTVDNDHLVWFLDGDEMPHLSGLTVEEFVDSDELGSDTSIRVVGMPENAELLLHLFEMKVAEDINHLQVCSPLCCESSEDRHDPEVLLYNMRSFGLSPSLGGWHDFDLKDYYIYSLVAVYEHPPVDVNRVRQMLAGHPAWSALTFIADLDTLKCAELFATIIDPRWYIDAAVDPNRGSKLEQYLGLNPRIQANLDKPNDHWQAQNCRLVMECWKNEVPRKNIGPRHFLWRAWNARGGGFRGDLVASKLFISFLRQTWLQAMCNTRHASHLFVPEYFFLQPDEMVAYKDHITKMGKKDD